MTMLFIEIDPVNYLLEWQKYSSYNSCITCIENPKIHIESQKRHRNKTILNQQKKKTGNITPSDFKIYHKSLVINLYGSDIKSYTNVNELNVQKQAYIWIPNPIDSWQRNKKKYTWKKKKMSSSTKQKVHIAKYWNLTPVSQLYQNQFKRHQRSKFKI